jgi:hypothetical protein
MTVLGRSYVAKTMPEKELQKTIREMATAFGWSFVYSVPDSRLATAKGMPDLILLKEGRLMFAELKTMQGRLTSEQVIVLDLLRSIPEVEVNVWRPDSLLDGTVEKALR